MGRPKKNEIGSSDPVDAPDAPTAPPAVYFVWDRHNQLVHGVHADVEGLEAARSQLAKHNRGAAHEEIVPHQWEILEARPVA